MRGTLARAWRCRERAEARRRLARWWAARIGYVGNRGGWIYHRASGRVICQGWESFYLRNRRPIWDAIFGAGAYDEAERERIEAEAERIRRTCERSGLWWLWGLKGGSR